MLISSITDVERFSNFKLNVIISLGTIQMSHVELLNAAYGS